jgi:hypothetical protein
MLVQVNLKVPSKQPTWLATLHKYHKKTYPIQMLSKSSRLNSISVSQLSPGKVSIIHGAHGILVLALLAALWDGKALFNPTQCTTTHYVTCRSTMSSRVQQEDKMKNYRENQ